jgi:hypothetical protein
MGIHGLMKLINEEVSAVFSFLFFSFPFSGFMSEHTGASNYAFLTMICLSVPSTRRQRPSKNMKLNSLQDERLQWMLVWPFTSSLLQFGPVKVGVRNSN